MKIEKNIIRKLKFNNLLDKEAKISKDRIIISCNSSLIEYDKIINSCSEIQIKCELKLLNKLNDLNIDYIKYNITDFKTKILEKRTNKSYIIVGAQLGTFLQDMKDFKTDSAMFLSSSKPVGIYQIGELNNINIYINPFLRWDDLSMIEYETEILYNYTITSIKHRQTPNFMLSQDIEIDIYSNLNEINVLNKMEIIENL